MLMLKQRDVTEYANAPQSQQSPVIVSAAQLPDSQEDYLHCDSLSGGRSPSEQQDREYCTVIAPFQSAVQSCHDQESPIPCKYCTLLSTFPAQESVSHQLQTEVVVTHDAERRSNISTEITHLTILENIVSISFPQLKAIINKTLCGAGVLNITHSQMHYHPPAGYIYRVRVDVTCENDGFNYDKQVFLTPYVKDVLVVTKSLYYFVAHYSSLMAMFFVQELTTLSICKPTILQFDSTANK